jgi:hypothetical protein
MTTIERECRYLWRQASMDWRKARKPVPYPPAHKLVAAAVTALRELERLRILHPHLKERMAQRGKTMRDILETVRKGEGVSGPQLDPYGDWRIRMRRFVSGRRVQVVVAVREKDFSVVTIF